MFRPVVRIFDVQKQNKLITATLLIWTLGALVCVNDTSLCVQIHEKNTEHTKTTLSQDANMALLTNHLIEQSSWRYDRCVLICVIITYITPLNQPLKVSCKLSRWKCQLSPIELVFQLCDTMHQCKSVWLKRAIGNNVFLVVHSFSPRYKLFLIPTIYLTSINLYNNCTRLEFCHLMGTLQCGGVQNTPGFI
jgi:hypothetical protein